MDSFQLYGCTISMYRVRKSLRELCSYNVAKITEGERSIDRLVNRVHLHRVCAHISFARGRSVRVGRSHRRPRGLFVALCVEPRDRREPLITDAESISISRGFTTCDAGRSRRPRASPWDYLAKRISLAALPRTRASCAFIQFKQRISHAQARLDPYV